MYVSVNFLHYISYQDSAVYKEYTVCFTSSCFRNRAAGVCFETYGVPKGLYVTTRLGTNFL